MYVGGSCNLFEVPLTGADDSIVALKNSTRLSRYVCTGWMACSHHRYGHVLLDGDANSIKGNPRKRR